MLASLRLFALRLFFLCVFVLWVSMGVSAHAQTAHTGGSMTYTSTSTSQFDVAVDSAGAAYAVGFGSTVYKGTFANGVFTSAQLLSGFSEASQIAVDSAGNLYIADGGGKKLYKETLSGGTYTQSVLATTTANYIFGVALDPAGNVYYTAASNLYKLTNNGGTYSGPVQLNTTAYSLAYGVSVDAVGNLYVADAGGNAIYKYAPNVAAYIETKLTISGLNLPEAALSDAGGNLYIHTVNYLTKATLNAGAYVVSNVAATGTEGYVAADPYGNIYSTLSNTSLIRLGNTAFAYPSTAVGTAATQTSVSFTIDTAGTLPALSNANVLLQGTSGLDFTLGTGSTCTGAVTAAQVCTVNVAFTPQYPGQRMGAVNLTNTAGAVLATAYISGTGTGPLATFTPGTISTIAGTGTACSTPASGCGEGVLATSATFYDPFDVALDGAGNVYTAGYGDQRIRKISAATGLVTTVAGTGTACSSPAGGCGDGSAATAGTVNFPSSVAVDGAGNLFIADQGDQRIRKVTAATGLISTVAGNGTACATTTAACGDGTAATGANLKSPSSVSVDGAGNLYIADQGDQRIRKVTAVTGVITTVAGTGTPCGTTTSVCGDGAAATSANFDQPFAVVVDGAGNLYISDEYDNRIRKVTASTGIVTTVAGTGATCGNGAPCGDGGLATATGATLYLPAGLALDGAGDLYIADYYSNRIRKVSAAGILSTVAATGNSCSASTAACGDGGAATSANLDYPGGVAVDGAGNLYVADTGDHRIRKVTATPANVNFANTTVGSTSAIQTITMNNIGNAALTFPPPSSGSNPTLPTDFNQSVSSTCPIVYTNSSAGTLAAGATCTEVLSFSPSVSTGESNFLLFTDNSLNVTGATQKLRLGGASNSLLTITLPSLSTFAGTTAVPVVFVVGYSVAGTPTATPTLKVDGTAVTLTNLVCAVKPLHNNCSATFNAAGLGTGPHTLLATQPADSVYTTAGTGTSTLTVLAAPTGVAAPVPSKLKQPVARRKVAPAQPVSGFVMSAPDAVSDPASTCKADAEGKAAKSTDAAACEAR